MGIIAVALGMIAGMLISWRILDGIYKKNSEEILRMSDKHLEMFLMMNRWLKNELDGKKVMTFLRENNFHNISIYGMGYIGKTLLEYLKKEGFEINNLIDQKSCGSIGNIRIKTMEDDQESTDVVIVTAIYYFEELENKLKEKFHKPVLSLADIVYKYS